MVVLATSHLPPMYTAYPLLLGRMAVPLAEDVVAHAAHGVGSDWALHFFALRMVTLSILAPWEARSCLPTVRRLREGSLDGRPSWTSATFAAIVPVDRWKRLS